MKTRHPRKRATARSRATKRQPLAALKNPKPRFTPSPALDWDDEFWPAEPEGPGFWTRLCARLF